MFSPRRSWWLAALLCALLLSVAVPVHAQGPDGTIPTGTTLDADVFLNTPDIVVDGNVNGDLFAVGQNVTINGNVGGSLFVVGDRVTLRGQISGSVYAVAANLNLDPTAKLDHSAYVIALSLLTTKGSVIERDLNTLAVGAQMTGNVTRNTRAIIGPVEIIRLILTRVESLNLFETVWNAAPRVPQALAFAQNKAGCRTSALASIGAASGALGTALDCVLNPPQTPPAQTGDTQTAEPNKLRDWGANRARDFVMLALLGLILTLAFPQRLPAWSASFGTRPWLTGLYGFLASLNGFLITAVLTLIVIVVGIVFQVLSLGALALFTWTLGLSLLTAGFWFFILLLFYVSHIVVAHWAAQAVLQRVAPNAKMHRVIPLLVGIFVLVLLMGLPLLGALISLLTAIWGMGGIVFAWREQFTTKRARGVQTKPA